MAKQATYFEDNKGQPHKSIEDAVASDIAVALGQIGGGGSGEAVGLAKKIIENRAEIERAFADLDAIAGRRPIQKPRTEN